MCVFLPLIREAWRGVLRHPLTREADRQIGRCGQRRRRNMRPFSPSPSGRAMARARVNEGRKLRRHYVDKKRRKRRKEGESDSTPPAPLSLSLSLRGREHLNGQLIHGVSAEWPRALPQWDGGKGSFSPWEPNKAFACSPHASRIASSCMTTLPFLFRTPPPPPSISLSVWQRGSQSTPPSRRGRLRRRRLITMTRPLKREMRG